MDELDFIVVETFPTFAGTSRYTAVRRWVDASRSRSARCGHLHWTFAAAEKCGLKRWTR